MVLTESARLESCFLLPLMSVLGTKKIKGFYLASSCHEGWVEIKGSSACLGLFISAVFLLQGYFAAASEILKHLKERFPPNSQHAQVEYIRFSL